MDTINDELRALGYLIKNSEITSIEKFLTAADLCIKIDKLAIVSTVIGEDVEKSVGINSPSCLIIERDNYFFVPLHFSTYKIKAIIASVVNSPVDRESPCVVCKSGTSSFCVHCNSSIYETCILSQQIPLLRSKEFLVYICPSCRQSSSKRL